MPDSNLPSNAEIASAARSSILCDGGLMNSVIEEFGMDVVIREVTSQTEDIQDAYADDTYTYLDHRTRAFVNVFNEMDDEVKEGIFQAGTVLLNFKTGDAPYVKTPNLVWFQSLWWKIASVVQNFSGTQPFYIQATLRKYGPTKG
jgi:hypothetical protein